jgi:glutamate-5-semialdehyde dehydrogenase
MALKDEMREMARQAREASHLLANLSTSAKNSALKEMAEELICSAPQLKKANASDLTSARKAGLSSALIDRLTLSDGVIQEMAESLQEVALLPDPVGQVSKMGKRPNGLWVGKMRIPLGVIGIIYESRPNVTSDAAGLCLKAGNAVILRGGKETIYSNTAIVKVIQAACKRAGIPTGCVQFIDNTDRALVDEMLKMNDIIDLIIPRGGSGLIRSVAAKATMPVVTGGIGVCHTYIDKSADIKKAVDIVYNAKVQRPSVCNAVEKILVHQDSACEFLPQLKNLAKNLLQDFPELLNRI